MVAPPLSPPVAVAFPSKARTKRKPQTLAGRYPTFYLPPTSAAPTPPKAATPLWATHERKALPKPASRPCTTPAVGSAVRLTRPSLPSAAAAPAATASEAAPAPAEAAPAIAAGVAPSAVAVRAVVARASRTFRAVGAVALKRAHRRAIRLTRPVAHPVASREVPLPLLGSFVK